MMYGFIMEWNLKKFEYLWPYPQQLKSGGSFKYPRAFKIEGYPLPGRLLADLKNTGKVKISRNGGCKLKLEISGQITKPEGYKLDMSSSGISIIGRDKPGLIYGVQTLLQVLAIHRESAVLPELHIQDWPAYRKRAFMVDMGRSTFTLPLLKRIVRILSRLKMNQLHLHLYDDELCGIKFDGLPFGKENPYAITIANLKELVRYAQDYDVEIMPELEAWGHAGSIVYHRKDLRGGQGMYAGSSFLICEKTFSLMKELIGQVARVMPQEACIHLGLDEAKWFPGKGLPKNFKPEDMIRRYHEILQELGRKYNKKLTLVIWADHGGRPVPRDIQDKIIIQPWNYWNVSRKEIDASIKKYSGKGKMRWFPGAGQSVSQHRGAFHATRYWCKESAKSPNIEGIDITYWGTNDLELKFMALFGGAYYTWNPGARTTFADVEDYEAFDLLAFKALHWWQTNFRDAFPDGIIKDRGPVVRNGFYLWGPKHYKPAAPTASAAGTFKGHDYINE